MSTSLDGSSLPGVPFDPAAAKMTPSELQQQIFHQQMMMANPQLTRVARRIYVGNLPIGIGLTENILMEFFTSAIQTLGIATPKAILSVWLSSPGTFCVCFDSPFSYFRSSDRSTGHATVERTVKRS